MDAESVGNNPLNGTVGKKKSLIWLFFVSGAVIVGLVIAVVVVVVNRGEKQPENQPPQTETPISDETEPTEAEEIYESVSDDIASAIADLYIEDKDEVLDVYKEYIDGVTNEEAKAKLLLDYYQVVMIYDGNREQKEAVIDGLLEIDKTLENITSAVVIQNAASYYSDDALYEKYNTILIEREKAAGIDTETEMETAG